MNPSVTPFLMFEGRAEEAMDFYVRTIPDSRVLEVDRYPANGPAPEGSIRVATFSLRGQRVRCTDSYIEHGFSFTPAISFFVDVADADELDTLYAALSEGGKTMMPIDNYGFSRRFAWVEDRFGVSWQLNLP